MFYLTDNSLKKGGKFYHCWMADSWPSRFAKLNARQLMSTNIVFVCDQLSEVISRESQNPMKNFSLRLSSQLLHGTVRLYERKATLFLNELCMFHATISRHINERDEPIKKRVKKTPAVVEATIAAETVPADLTREEERILANLLEYNVARHEDITLREDVIPTIVEPRYDGFGEENPNEAIEMLFQTEAMRRKEGTMADLTVQRLNESALDRSRDVTRVAAINRSGMELEASGREERRTGLEGQDETLLLVPESNVDENQLNKIPDIIVSSTPINDAKPDEVVPTKALEDDLTVELAPPPVKRRRRVQRKLIIDKKIKLDSEYMMSRQVPNVDLRCETAKEDVVIIRVTPAELLNRPSMFNDIHPIFGEVHKKLFFRNVYSLPMKRDHDVFNRFFEEHYLDNTANTSAVRAAFTETPNQSTEEGKSKRSKKKLPSIIEEEVEAPVQQVPQPLQLLPEAIAPQQPMELELSTVEQVVVDISDLPTQKLNENEEIIKEDEQEPSNTRRRTRSSSVLSQEQQIVQEVQVVAQIHASMHPEEHPVIHHEETVISNQRVSNALQQLGLASSDQRKSKETNSSDSETAGGSIDRTQVDLGDESFTSSQINRRSEWGPEAVMLKIISLVRSGHKCITLDLLLESGAPHQNKKIAAAKIFYSLLRLKSASMVELIKHENSNKLKNIVLGDRFK